MVHRYNEIFRVQMPNITPHVYRHTYLLQQSGQGWDEPDDAPVHGALGYQHDDERLHPSGTGGHSSSVEMDREEVEEVLQEQEKVSSETGLR